jgi:hypothetical protein
VDLTGISDSFRDTACQRQGIKFFAQKALELLPSGTCSIDYVAESTEVFTKEEYILLTSGSVCSLLLPMTTAYACDGNEPMMNCKTEYGLLRYELQ